MYPKYVVQIERIQSFLTDLNSHDDSKLTKRQRMQKGLVRTLLKLMVIEKQKEKQK